MGREVTPAQHLIEARQRGRYTSGGLIQINLFRGLTNIAIAQQLVAKGEGRTLLHDVLQLSKEKAH